MRIGLYFGSFNPIHHAHLIIANHILNEGLVDKVWLIVSPQNPLKESASLLDENQRFNLVNLAIEPDDRLRASNIEFSLPRPSYTAVTLAHLVEKYPRHEFVVIMGSDSFQNIPRWKNYRYILDHFPILIYKRPGFDITETHGGQITTLNAPLLELSATAIRGLIRERKSLQYLLPREVIAEIEKAGYYRK